MKITVLCADSFAGVYCNGSLADQGKDLDGETAWRLFRSVGAEVELYTIPPDVYDRVLAGEGFPPALTDFPVSECESIPLP